MLPYIERGEAGMVVLAEDDSTDTYFWCEPVQAFDISRLPPLPAGATHVVLADGGTVAGWIADETPAAPAEPVRAFALDGAALASKYGDFEGAMSAVIDNHS